MLRTAVRDLLKKGLWSIIERIEEAKQATETY